MAHDISGLKNISGFIGACIADSESGMVIATESSKDFDVEAAGALNSEVVKTKLKAMAALGLDDVIEDMLITLGKQYHLIRPLASNPQAFVYVALDKASANLALARMEVKKVEAGIEL